MSLVSRALCNATLVPVVIKAYERARMKPKHYTRLAREVKIMSELGGNKGLARLTLPHICKRTMEPGNAAAAAPSMITYSCTVAPHMFDTTAKDTIVRTH